MNYDNLPHVFDLFCGTDPLRESLLEPFFDQGFVCATNAYVAIRLNHKLVQNATYRNKPDVTPNMAEVFKTKVEETTHSVTYDAAHELIKKLPHDLLYDDCQQCKGKGEIKCDCCNQYSHCAECDGSGDGTDVIGMDINHYQHLIELIGVQLDPNLLKKIVDSTWMLGYESFEIASIKSTKGIYFKIGGDVEGLILANINDQTKIHKLDANPLISVSS